MRKKGWAKEVFPGGNTYKGFHSFYDYIISDEANRIFVIKGGPGVGKSSFMKNIAKEFINLGYDVELHHCSSDNNSLDGVVIKAAKVALLDGTAPHVVDPKNPGAVDEILNFGEFWDEEGMQENRDAILSCNKEVKRLFGSAYHYLNAAKEMQDDIESIYKEALDRAKFSQTVLELKNELIVKLENKKSEGSIRHLFDSAITPDGIWDYIETVIPKDYNCYYIKGEPGTGSTELLNMLAQDFSIKGYGVELYHQPLNPERLQTLVVDELKLALTVNEKMQSISQLIDLDANIDNKKLVDRLGFINKDKEMMEILMYEGVKRISAAKKVHDEMEKSYIPNMDFECISQLKEAVIEKIKRIMGI